MARIGGLVSKAVGVLLSVSAGMVHVTGHVTSCDWSCDKNYLDLLNPYVLYLYM